MSLVTEKIVRVELRMLRCALRLLRVDLIMADDPEVTWKVLAGLVTEF